MKKEFKDLDVEDRKEYLMVNAITIDLPYTILMLPFLVLLVITSNTYIGIASAAIASVAVIGAWLNTKKLKGLYGI